MNVTEDLRDALQDISRGLEGGGRLQRARIITLGTYAALAVLTLLWGLSGTVLLANPIGARIEARHVEETQEYWILLLNESQDEWTQPQLTLNNNYIYTHPEPIPPSHSVRVLIEEFRYQLYVPRAPRAEGWLSIDPRPPHRPYASNRLKPETVTLRTAQGEHTERF